MRVPNISRRKMSRKVLTQFGGINKTPDIAEGEWADAENLSCARFPALTVREGFKTVAGANFGDETVKPLIAYNEGLVELVPDANPSKYDHLYFKGAEIGDYHNWIEDSVSGGYIGLSRYRDIFGHTDPRQAVCFGTKVIFMPYRTYFDVKTQEVGTLYRNRDCANIRLYPLFEDGSNIKGRKRYTAVTPTRDAFPYNVDPTGTYKKTFVTFQEVYKSNVEVGTQEYNIYQGGYEGVGWQLQTKVKYKIIYRGEPMQEGNVFPPISDGIYEGDRITLEMTYADGGARCPLSGAFTVDEVGEGYIVVSNNDLDSAAFFEFIVNKCDRSAEGEDEAGCYGCLMGLLSLRREVPEMSWLCANNNRLFGCSPDGHTIYASYLGDPFNWTNYEATSMASYFATVASPGVFTGLCAWEDRVVFFKENFVHVLSGSYPAAFSITDIETAGPRSGTAVYNVEEKTRVDDCSNFAVVGGVVYYGTADGVFRWSGGYAEKISQALGEGVYRPRAAFAVRDLLYIFMRIPDEDAEKLYVYDTRRGIWHADTGLATSIPYPTTGYCYALGGVILCRERSGDDGYLAIGFDATDGAQGGGDSFDWYAESGVLGAAEPDRKFVGKIQIVADIPANGELSVGLMYNGDGFWHDCLTFSSDRRQTHLIPITPHRSDNVRLRLHGHGKVTVYNITYYYERATEYGRSKY